MRSSQEGSHGILAALVCLSLSAAANAGIFAVFERTIVKPTEMESRILKKARAAKQKEEKFEFEFVEAPPQDFERSSEKTRKISERDALNQDLTQDKSEATGTPKTQIQGPADQLAQV